MRRDRQQQLHLGSPRQRYDYLEIKFNEDCSCEQPDEKDAHWVRRWLAVPLHPDNAGDLPPWTEEQIRATVSVAAGRQRLVDAPRVWALLAEYDRCDSAANLDWRGPTVGVRSCAVDERDTQQFEAIIALLQQVDPWLQRISSETPPEPVGAHSSLAGDDRITDPHQTSHAVWHSISHAVDHLHMLQTVLGKTGVIHMYAPFSVVRAALENASAAVWLLAPPARRERVLRRCRFAAGDARAGDAAAALVILAGKPRKPLTERLDRAADRSARRS